MAKTKATDRSSNQSTVPSWLEQINDEIVVKANLEYNSKELIDLANAVKEASEKAIHDASKIAIDAQEHLKKLAEEKAKYEIELAKELAKIESDRQLNLLKNQEKFLELTEQEKEKRKELLDLQQQLSQAQTDAEREQLEKAVEDKEKEIKKLEKDLKNTQGQKDKIEKQAAKESETARKKNEAKKVLEGGKPEGYSFSDFTQAWLSTKFENKKQEYTKGATGVAGVLNSVDHLAHKIADLGKKLTNTIDNIGSYKGRWDTRLMGSNSTFNAITDNINKAAALTPYVKQSDIMKHIDDAVQKGIARDIEQIAFLQTAKEGIADTFNAFDATLLNIIRVQQSNSTAARLGMEASLKEFLNENFKNTEYLSNVLDTVTTNLYQATSLLNSERSIDLEYQAQKWFGSLYSVGMSSQAIGNIATALGKLASGDISGTDSGAGKLLVMAASRSGLNYSDMLIDGLNGSEINDLMYSVVGYLAEIAKSSENNNVIQTQYASIFDLQTSDIQSVKNIMTNLDTIYNQGKSYEYSSAINSLFQTGSTYKNRISVGGLLTNIRENFNFTLSKNIADSPALYGIWTMSNLLDELVGGINIPSFGGWVAGSGSSIDLETTVADLMKVGALSGSLLGSIGSMISSLGNVGSGLSGMMKDLGISNKATQFSRSGTQQATFTTSGLGVSSSSFIGNTSGEDVAGSSFAGIDDEKSSLKAEAQDETEGNDVDINTINNNIVLIYEMFKEIIIGGALTVRPADGTLWVDSYLPY